jgi:coproporphyrinogen III oxidase
LVVVDFFDSYIITVTPFASCHLFHLSTMTNLEKQFEKSSKYFRSLQDRICESLVEADGKASFCEDTWERPGGGGGRSRVLQGGGVFEKAGVNFSVVFGQLSPEFAQQLPGEGLDFRATGISLVLHPGSPKVPTVHANFRYLVKGNESWFGGGADLTPYYPYRDDVIHFHKTWKAVCGRHAAPVDYAKFKKDCDEYFYLAHRQEPRGVGGIFFDYLDGDFESLCRFVRDCGDSFVEAYVPIVQKRKSETFTPQERLFQEFRRGRYVEFNLIYDRGTTFGLKTGGRIESILMSLPPVVRWLYDFKVEPGSREAELYDVYLKPRDWASEE